MARRDRALAWACRRLSSVGWPRADPESALRPSRISGTRSGTLVVGSRAAGARADEACAQAPPLSRQVRAPARRDLPASLLPAGPDDSRSLLRERHNPCGVL